MGNVIVDYQYMITPNKVTLCRLKRDMSDPKNILAILDLNTVMATKDITARYYSILLDIDQEFMVPLKAVIDELQKKTPANGGRFKQNANSTYVVGYNIKEDLFFIRGREHTINLPLKSFNLLDFYELLSHYKTWAEKSTVNSKFEVSYFPTEFHDPSYGLIYGDTPELKYAMNSCWVKTKDALCLRVRDGFVVFCIPQVIEEDTLSWAAIRLLKKATSRECRGERFPTYSSPKNDVSISLNKLDDNGNWVLYIVNTITFTAMGSKVSDNELDQIHKVVSDIMDNIPEAESVTSDVVPITIE